MDANAVGGEVDVADLDLDPGPALAAGQEREQLALDEMPKTFAHMGERLVLAVGGGTLRSSEAGKQLRNRSRVQAGPQEADDRFAVRADHDRIERRRAIGPVEPPVFL